MLRISNFNFPLNSGTLLAVRIRIRADKGHVCREKIEKLKGECPGFSSRSKT